MALQGDSIICAVEYDKFEHGRVPVVFTLNGEVIYEASMSYKKGKQELFPFIGMGHKGIRVLAKVRFRRRAYALISLKLFSFRISLRWPIYIINPVDKTKLS